MKRTVINIDEDLCYGCGNCVSGCHEGALQLIDGKAVLISDLYCDGLGACIGECPVGAITLEEREAVPYDEIAVMERIIPKGESVILAHLKHLKEHNEMEWVQQGVQYLKDHNIEVNLAKIGLDRIIEKNSGADNSNSNSACESTDTQQDKPLACGCPGSMAREIKRDQFSPVSPIHNVQGSSCGVQRSELSHFPVQMHLINPQAGFFNGADMLLAADCTAFASGEFHSKFLKNKVLAIACPKLDSNTQIYVDKLVELIDQAKINTLTVLIMEVPCCGGLVRIVEQARTQAHRNVPVKVVVLSVNGDIKREEWI